MAEVDQDHDTAAIEHLDVAVPCDRERDCQHDAAWVVRWRAARFACGKALPTLVLFCDEHQVELLDNLTARLYCVEHMADGPRVLDALLSVERL